MKRIYWECSRCGYFIDIDIVQCGLPESELLQIATPCENPNCDGIMRVKIEGNEK